jgi:glycosyltransferase involved in cell wall biosynthesis
LTSISPTAATPNPDADARRGRKLLFLVTEDWYFVSHRLELAVAAREAGYDVVVATRVDRHGERIVDAGLRLCPIAFNRSGLNPLEELRTLIDVVRAYRREKPDIVHHVALKPIIYGSLAARLSGIGGIVNALAGFGYVFSSSGLLAKILRAVVKPLLKFALGGSNSRLIVQNRDHYERILRDGWVKPGAVSLIRGAGIDPAAFQVANAASDPPLVVLPARLLWEKGVGEFVEAAKRLRARGVDARFVLVGRPDPANPASVGDRDVDAWVREGVVEAWGWREDMVSVFAQAQIACLPSYHEGLPRSLLEAAASGCAMVATDIPGCREIVRPGVTGWLVPAQDTGALVDALQQAIAHPALRRQYGAAARALIASDFSVARVAGETIAIYRELTGGERLP